MIGWLKKFFGKEPEPQPRTVIWGIIDGPYVRDDFPEEELWNNGIDPDADAMLVCKVEEDGHVFVANYWFPTLEDARDIKAYFDSNIEPLEVDLSRIKDN